MTSAELQEFEEDIAAEFASCAISSPIHLSGGNEEDLISIFRSIEPSDWVLAGWRSHYHCLLKGVPSKELKARIMEGHSVSLCFAKQKVLCSGICGGIAPIAVGIAWGLRQRVDSDPYAHTPKVWCFLGDMSAETGIVHESIKYASRNGLPVNWIIEDNGVSISTDTKKSWGTRWEYSGGMTRRYEYALTRPHCGIGKWIRF